MSSSEPLWREEFSVFAEDQQYVTRRQLTKFLVLTSLGMFVGNLWLLGRAWLRREPFYPLRPIAAADELAIGESRVFHYPTEKDDCLLLRLGESHYVAYSQQCTHLACAVFHEPEAGELVCPCHHGAFDPATGRVLYGPPPRPLPRVRLIVEDGVVVATGIELASEA